MGDDFGEPIFGREQNDLMELWRLGRCGTPPPPPAQTFFWKHDACVMV